MPRNELETLLLDTVADALGVARLDPKKSENRVLILPPGFRPASESHPHQRAA